MPKVVRVGASKAKSGKTARVRISCSVIHIEKSQALDDSATDTNAFMWFCCCNSKWSWVIKTQKLKKTKQNNSFIYKSRVLLHNLRHRPTLLPQLLMSDPNLKLCAWCYAEEFRSDISNWGNRVGQHCVFYRFIDDFLLPQQKDGKTKPGVWWPCGLGNLTASPKTHGKPGYRFVTEATPNHPVLNQFLLI